MKPTNEKELEWFINGVLSTCHLESENYGFYIVPLDNRFKVVFAKYKDKLVPSGVGDEKVNEPELIDEDHFTWLKSESIEKLRDYTEDIVKWLND